MRREEGGEEGGRKVVLKGIRFKLGCLVALDELDQNCTVNGLCVFGHTPVHNDVQWSEDGNLSPSPHAQQCARDNQPLLSAPVARGWGGGGGGRGKPFI